SIVLNDLLDNKYYTLVNYWAIHCVDKGLIVEPRLLPKFFDWGVHSRKSSPELFVKAIGNRGVWLSGFEEQWKFVTAVAQQFDWDTAPIGLRVKHLQDLRTEAPAEAVEKIKQVWKEENAANRVELIATLAVGISKADEEFLLTALTDKSQKVKEKALELVKLIPDSAIIESYKACLRASITITQSKLLGLISRTTVHVKLQLSNDGVFKTGIQKLSSTKEIGDDDYVLMQMIADVPPAFWLQHFQMNIAQVVEIFGKDDLKKFQPWFCQAVLKFAAAEWAKPLLDNFSNAPVQLLSLLPAEERLTYAGKFLAQHTDEVLAALYTGSLQEWSIGFVKQLLPFLADNPHRYNKQWFEAYIIYLPAGIDQYLDGITLTDEWKNTYWSGIKDEIRKLLLLKEQIKKAFI
ncbi:MAG TPA: DUF5691 domain-containing protein, partial [Chitinophagales bacterium]|nr:DUF5691 domain-containing protein [Chitinophagales bacterium]